ncbi:MAG: hypothetical protein LBT54_07185 [Bifidobacteriaceae bacterium]|nr:hypothetical protein [Bifidobacteriaceae bacterium]
MAIVVSTKAILIESPQDLISGAPLSKSLSPSQLCPSIPPTTGLERDSTAVCNAVRAVARARLLRKLVETPGPAFGRPPQFPPAGRESNAL